jgi:hypothetical protein
MSILKPCWIPLALALGATGLSCSPSASSGEGIRNAFSLPDWKAVLTDRLEEFAEEGLPQVTEDDVLDVQDLLLMSAQGGRTSARATDQLQAMDASLVTSACLTLVETHNMDLETRLLAYGWMRLHAPISVVPRLTLRLKYEKDWPANVDVARTLLRHQSGAGLDALIGILQEESGDERIELARFLTMEVLQELPLNQTSGEQPLGFDQQWQGLLETQSHWARHRQLPQATKELGEPAPRALRAEAWRMLAHFRSQRLRPVDDARFVYVRLPQSLSPLLLETAFDEDRYVREHALQTMEWIGYPFGRWGKDHQQLLFPQLLALRGDALMRPRLISVMGAIGLDGLAGDLIPWLREGNLEESTAAADALLRCAGEAHLRSLEAATAELYESLSPEAQYSLKLTIQSLQGGPLDEVEAPELLDDSERQRRLVWAAGRTERP